MTLKRTALWCGAGLAALLGIAALTVALAVTLAVRQPELIRPYVQRALAPRGGSATLAGLSVTISPPTLAISGLVISGPPGEGELLRIDRLQAELIPARIFSGGPRLRHVEAKNIVFERLRPSESETPLDLTPLTRLFDIEDLSLTDARVRLAFPGGDLAAEGLNLSLIPGEGGIRALTGDGKLTLRSDGSVFAEGNLSARGKVTPDPAIEVSLELAAARLSVRGQDIGGLPLKGDLAFRSGSFSGNLNGDNLSAAALLSLAKVLSGRGLDGWSPSGTVSVAARIEPEKPGPRVTAKIKLEQIGFSSPPGDVMGGKLSGRLDLDCLLGPKPRMKADLVINQGEALWGTVYVNFMQNPLDLHAGGTRAATDEYKDLLIKGGLAGFGRLKLEGKARRAGGTWHHQGRLELGETGLGPVFKTFLKDPLAAGHPDLASLKMDGTVRMELSFSGKDKAVDLNGRLLLRSGTLLREGEPSVFSGLEIDLPISYSVGIADPGRSGPLLAAEWGRLSLKELRLGEEKIGPLDMPAVLVPNRLYLGGNIDASLFGAKLLLQRIQVDEPHSPNFRIHLAAKVDGLDLSKLSSKMEGRLGGVLDPVQIDSERVTATGDLTGELFGGKTNISRVTVARPFTPGREFGGDIKVDLVDMERLSAALSSGRVTGRISGSVEGLRISYGQPVAFHLKMESVPTKGMDQTVSVKAVNSISVVSTGSSLGGSGSSFMMGFFKDFPYSKIGFECGLKNDVFTVRGLIREDGVEYLVKRRLLGGINVVNGNPDNRIGFSDMVERAKRATGEKNK
ncbi:MAG: hypothetical protein HW408_34 [Actinobacteria bacterium]|nr:hypothetical protein [Actinomycetota bacterium]